MKRNYSPLTPAGWCVAAILGGVALALLVVIL